MGAVTVREQQLPLLISLDQPSRTALPCLCCCAPWPQVRARFVERFSMGAPVMGGEVRGPAITGEHRSSTAASPPAGLVLDCPPFPFPACAPAPAPAPARRTWACLIGLALTLWSEPPTCPPTHPCCAGMHDKINWVEKFVEVGRSVSQEAKAEHER